MQMSTPHPDSGSVRKICNDTMCAVREPYSLKGVPFLFANLDSQGFERVEGVGHQALSTTFIYGRFECLNYRALNTFLAQSDCCSQAGRTTANDHNVSEICSRSLTHHSSDSNPYQISCDQHVPALEGNRPASKIERIGPEHFGGMHHLNHAANRLNAMMHLMFACPNNPGWIALNASKDIRIDKLRG